MEAKQTPLIDLLENVPRDTVLVVEHDQFSSSSYPVGRLCHEAAAALRAVLAEVERLREDAERYRWLRDREIPEWLDLWHQNPDRIDAAIDQARGKGVAE